MNVSPRSRILWSLATIFLMGTICAGCPAKEPAPAKTDEAAEARRANTVKTAPAEVVTPGMKMLRSSGLAVIDSNAKVTKDQLGISDATGAETYKVIEPALRIFIFSYSSSAVAAEAIQTVVGWINRSGLVHNAEAMADKSRILVVGTPTPALPEEAVKKQINDLMDSFVGEY